jgi:hypothetical protein
MGHEEQEWSTNERVYGLQMRPKRAQWPGREKSPERGVHSKVISGLVLKQNIFQSFRMWVRGSHYHDR